MERGLVSVVMGVHNEKKEHLKSAFESLFRQSYQNVELIVIDDASNESCKLVLKELCDNRPNVKIVHNDINQGLTKSLNIGLQLAKGEFIARMDADDIATPDRLEKQVDFLNIHQDIAIVGTGVVSFGNEHIFMSPAFGLSDQEAKCLLFFSSTLCHPSVMIRKCFLEKNNLSYDENVLKAQDYDLWERASIYGKLAVLSDVLLYYRVHAAQITSQKRDEQNKAADIIRKRRLARLGIIPTDREYRYHKLLSCGVDTSVTTKEMESWVKKILKGNEEKHLVESQHLRNNLEIRLLLFKLRNKKMIRWNDFPKLVTIIISRIRIKVKLIAQNKRFLKEIGNE